MNSKKLRDDDREVSVIMLELLYEKERENFTPLDEMKRRVIQECIERDAERKRKRKRVMRRTASIAANAACVVLIAVLLVGVMPNVSVNATMWMQQAMIWIGDTLHIYEYAPSEEPVYNTESVTPETGKPEGNEPADVDTMHAIESIPTYYYSIDAFENSVGVTVPRPGWLPEGMKLTKIEVEEDLKPFDIARFYFESAADYLEIDIRYLRSGYRMEIGENVSDIQEIGGRGYIVFTGPKCDVLTYSGTYEVDIEGDMSEEDFRRVLEEMDYSDEQ